MARCGIKAIDDFFDGSDAAPLVTGSSDRLAVGLVQDLLSAGGVKGMPNASSPNYGTFGPGTTKAVRAFQQSQGLPVLPAGDETVANIDAATVKALADANAVSPVACCGYISLALDLPFTGLLRVMSITMLFEGGGKFTAQNHNTDGAGLSYGLIQWAQKPGRLNELLRAFQSIEPQVFVNIFGGGNQALADGLVNHTAKPNGGVNSAGATTDAAFDLIREPWTGRFNSAGLDRALQRVQVTTAVTAFTKSMNMLKGFAPEIRTERGIAFMLDLANQHGDGGAKSIVNAVRAAQPAVFNDESRLLLAIENESVRRVTSQFAGKKNGTAIIQSTKNRRESFRTTPMLSDAVFDPN
jgi:peptidoglycan hydrolase-like protein with peptidoglycan-binding domain